MRTFRSDNNAGMTPEAIAALRDAATGHAIGYGDDECTSRAVAALRSLFGVDAAVFLVATGTAANTLAVASLTDPWRRVLCHAHAHWNDDESTAPERLTQCRTTTIHPAAGDGSKLSPDDVLRAGASGRGDVHQPAPGVLTISNPTEFGTIYTPDEVRALCDAAHSLGYLVHIDGARFANAVAALLDRGVHAAAAPLCRALTIDAGADALSFGGTKNGLALGEAVVFFPQGDGAAFERAARAFPFHRKSFGHLISKHRFVSAPFAATIADGSWIRHARRANTLAGELGASLGAAGVAVRFPVETNGVFVELAGHVHAALQQRGHRYYPFGDPAWRVYRLMCSFDTQQADIDALVADARAAIGA